MSAGYDALRELALDLRWSWDHASDVIWKTPDADLWEATRNPCDILHIVSRDTVRDSFALPWFAAAVQALLIERQRVEQLPGWFQTTHAATPLRTVAYFSVEFMLSEALPIYSGGLGNVAGDQLKAAADLGVPVVGIGLLYAQGYFRQAIAPDGSQEALYPVNYPGQLPVRLLREANGGRLRVRT